MWKVVSSIYTSYIYIYHINTYIYIVYIIYIHMNLYTLLYNDLHNPILELYDISHRIGTQNDDTWAMALAWPGLRKQVLFYLLGSVHWTSAAETDPNRSNDGRGTPNRCQSIATLRSRPGSGSGNHGILTIQTSSAIPGKMSHEPRIFFDGEC